MKKRIIGKIITYFLAGLIIILLVFDQIVKTGYTAYIYGIIGLLLIILIAVGNIFFRCPHCHQFIGRKDEDYCPHCKKKLK